jgi:uncharacterized protein (TIRG00374 family)
VERAGYFLDTQDEPRVRRARTAVGAVAGALLVLVTSSNAVRISSLQQAISKVVDTLPGWSEVLFWIGYGLGAVYAVFIVVGLVLRSRRNPGAVRDVVLAMVLAAALAALLMRWREGAWPSVLPEFGLEDPLLQYPIFRAAVLTAIVVASSPHITTALRRLGFTLVAVVTISGFGLGFGFPTDAIAALGVGMFAAGAVLLFFGSPSGYPQAAVVAAALRDLGLRVDGLALAPDQSWGTRRFVGTGDDGAPVEVKAYGKDAVDTQIASKLWRAMWYRGTGTDDALSRSRAVEHEALIAFLADRAGVPSVEPLAAGRAGDDVAILAVQRPGTPLAALAAEEVSDELLTLIWEGVGRLHGAGIAHGSLTTNALSVADDGHLFADYAAGQIAAGDARQHDVVQLLFSLANQLGIERAVSTARSGLGDDALSAALPYLQLPALSKDGRRAAAKPKALMQDLKAAVAEATGVEPPEPVKLRRVGWGQLLMLGLVLFAANALITQLAGIDYAAVWEVIEDAAWLALLVAFLVSHLSFFAEAGSMLAAVGQPLPFRPLVVLQLAARFIGLAVPSAAGRVAMNSAFLVKFGVNPAIAVVQGAIDGVSGFAVEAGILVVALVVSDQSFHLGGDIDWQRILLIVLAVVVIGASLVFFVGRLRTLVLPVLKDALSSLRGVLQDPRRALRLLTNNFLGRAALGLTLWIILRAVGVDDISIAVALVVTVATNLLAGLVPIPGGIGVAEAVMTSWLVLVGVPESEAFAVTVVYRMSTFYVPAIEGFVAMKWLENRDYL